MKKLLLITAVTVWALVANAQNYCRVFGNATFNTLDTHSPGLVTFDSTGTLHPLNFNGNANTVLTGNGTFASASSLSAWVQSGTSIYYTGGNVGIGTTHPNYPLQIVGNVVDSGSLFATNIATSNSISVGTFRIVNGVVDSITSQAALLKLNATTINASGILVARTLAAGYGSSAITLDGYAGTITSPSGTVGFGTDTIVTTATVKAGSMQVGYFKTDSIYTSEIIPRDSVIYFGDPVASMTLPTGIEVAASGGLGFGSCPFPVKMQSYSGAWVFGGSPTFNTMRFGIGTICPQAILDVEGNTSSGIPGLVVGSGNVGIGTSTPASALDINSPAPYSGQIANFRHGNSDVFIVTNMSNGGGDWNYLPQINDNGIFWSDGLLGTSGQNVSSGFVIAPFVGSSAGIRIEASGNVGIGTALPTYPLDVNGTIRANEVLVCLFGTCDFVFEKDYNLMPIKDLEQYLQLNHHLPGIPSAKDMEENGNVSLGKMDSQLLQKVEELTLYIIQQQKEIDKQNEQISQMNEKLNSLGNK